MAHGAIILLFFLGGGGRPSSGVRAKGRHRNAFFPSHLLCTIKSQMGGQWGGGA